jgi:hypothetical protein
MKKLAAVLLLTGMLVGLGGWQGLLQMATASLTGEIATDPDPKACAQEICIISIECFLVIRPTPDGF